jgi:hypothetical protein
MRIRVDKITFSFYFEIFSFQVIQSFCFKRFEQPRISRYITNTLEFSAANNSYLLWLFVLANEIGINKFKETNCERTAHFAQ